jgi:hypothetical protein
LIFSTTPYVPVPVFGGAHEVGVVVDEAGNHGLPFEIDRSRAEPGEFGDLGVSTGGDGALALDRDRLVDCND